MIQQTPTPFSIGTTSCTMTKYAAAQPGVVRGHLGLVGLSLSGGLAPQYAAARGRGDVVAEEARRALDSVRGCQAVNREPRRARSRFTA
jgi:hypothetical protein